MLVVSISIPAPGPSPEESIMESDTNVAVIRSPAGIISQASYAIHLEVVTSLQGNQIHQKALSRLQVMRARHINRITWVNFVVCSLGLALSISYLIWTRTGGFEYLEITTADGRNFKIPSFKISALMSLLDAGSGAMMVLVATVLTPVYFLRVFRNNKLPVTGDQVMVFCLLVMNFISVNPFYAIYTIHDYVIYPNDFEKKWQGLPWAKFLVDLSYTAMYGSWACGIMLYVWIRIDMFRILEKLTRRQLFFRIVLPKLIVALVYWTLLFTTRLIYTSLWGLLPFTSIICILVNRSVVGDHFPFILVVYACCITALELTMIFGIAFTAMLATKKLRPLNYFKYRSRIIAFRFFVTHNIGFMMVFTVIDNVVAIVIPPGFRLQFSFRYPSYSTLPSFNMNGLAALVLMKIVWIVTTAYVSLPADSVGFRGWFKSSYVSETNAICRVDEVDPVSLSLHPTPVTNPRIFGFRDAVLMFNLSWLAYTERKAKMNFYSGQFAAPDKFEVIFEEKFETRVILVTLPDRIAVAFRGTTTTANISTDLKVALDLVDDFLPSRLVNPNPRESIKAWMRAKLHHGFAVAYREVADKVFTRIEQLLCETRRPVYLTGHSLGGALATICSLDLILSGIVDNASQVSVITFGSPKCGNKDWTSVYNMVVPSNWNVRIESDVVSKLPRFPYEHVGKTALLTTGGNLLLDPSALDSSWSNEIPSIEFHKKPAYKMALFVVCEKHLQGMMPGIWDFPINESVVRVWERQCKITFSEQKFAALVGCEFKPLPANRQF